MVGRHTRNGATVTHNLVVDTEMMAIPISRFPSDSINHYVNFFFSPVFLLPHLYDQRDVCLSRMSIPADTTSSTYSLFNFVHGIGVNIVCFMIIYYFPFHSDQHYLNMFCNSNRSNFVCNVTFPAYLHRCSFQIRNFLWLRVSLVVCIAAT